VLLGPMAVPGIACLTCSVHVERSRQFPDQFPVREDHGTHLTTYSENAIGTASSNNTPSISVNFGVVNP
jgi:hypothetical protein